MKSLFGPKTVAENRRESVIVHEFDCSLLARKSVFRGIDVILMTARCRVKCSVRSKQGIADGQNVIFIFERSHRIDDRIENDVIEKSAR